MQLRKKRRGRSRRACHSTLNRIVALAENEPPGGGGGAIDWTMRRAAASSSATPDDRTTDTDETLPLGPIVKATPTAPVDPRARADSGKYFRA